MTHGSLFSGIGGFDLAAQWMGWTNVFHCEWNPFGQKILHHYWPNAIQYHDITKTDFSIHRGAIDILTGGFPCQPYSQAGKRLGKEDERHLWPEMLRAIREIQPRWVVGENVLGLVNWSGGLVFHEVQADLEAEGYEVQPFVLPACAVNAPHRRDRVWFVAYSNKQRHTSCGESQGIEAIRSRNDGKQKKRAEQTQRLDRLHGFSRNAADTKNDRCNCWKNHHKRKREQLDKDKQREYEENGCKSCGCSNEIIGICRYGFDSCKWIGDTEQCDICEDGSNYQEDENADWDATDSKGVRGNREEEHENNNRQGREWGRCDADNSCKISNGTIAADTELQGYTGLHKTWETNNVNRENTKIRRSFTRYNQENNWSTFPTVPPICHGDDGLSDRLDNITFSRWRQESIKGGGNAVVPQVVLRIFETIEEYENM